MMRIEGQSLVENNKTSDRQRTINPPTTSFVIANDDVITRRSYEKENVVTNPTINHRISLSPLQPNVVQETLVNNQNNNNNSNETLQQQHGQHSVTPIPTPKVTKLSFETNTTTTPAQQESVSNITTTNKNYEAITTITTTTITSTINVYRYLKLFVVVPILLLVILSYFVRAYHYPRQYNGKTWLTLLSQSNNKYNNQNNNNWQQQQQQAPHSSSLYDTKKEVLHTESDIATTVSSLQQRESNKVLTLREILLCQNDIDTFVDNNDSCGFHLAVAPAFFGFYGYFGIIAAWYDIIELQQRQHQQKNFTTSITKMSTILPIHSVVGASAGAMVAILLAANITPMDAMIFCSTITLDQYSDFPGFLSLFRGNLFEQLLIDFLTSQPKQQQQHDDLNRCRTITQMEDSIIPVAVTAFDIQSLSTKIITNGSMARAARASATFPGLFQPVGWSSSSMLTTSADNNSKQKQYDSLLIDGGVMDQAGMMGLSYTIPLVNSRDSISNKKRQRVIHLQLVGGGGGISSVVKPKTLPGPKEIIGHPDIITISITGLPFVSPFTMYNGPIAYNLARDAMLNAMDVPLVKLNTTTLKSDTKKSNDDNFFDAKHYHLIIDVNKK